MSVAATAKALHPLKIIGRMLHGGTRIANAFCRFGSEWRMEAAMRNHFFRFARAAVACILAMTAMTASADDTARINNLESELQRLRTQVAEQNRRIQRLEAQIEQLGGVRIPDPDGLARSDTAAKDKVHPTGPQPWHSAKTWEQVAVGMSQAEVIAILGDPTAVEAVDNYKTLFYSDGAAGGDISGHVNLKDDLVVAIKTPASR